MKSCMRNSGRGNNFTSVISALASLGQLTSHSWNCRLSPLVAQYTNFWQQIGPYVALVAIIIIKTLLNNYLKIHSDFYNELHFQYLT